MVPMMALLTERNEMLRVVVLNLVIVALDVVDLQCCGSSHTAVWSETRCRIDGSGSVCSMRYGSSSMTMIGIALDYTLKSSRPLLDDTKVSFHGCR